MAWRIFSPPCLRFAADPLVMGDLHLRFYAGAPLLSTGGPAVEPATRKGFGAKLVGAGLRTDLGGTGVTEFLPEGVHWSLSANLAHVEQV